MEFLTFAVPTIIGEIKRHFRDKGWAVRVPRRLQELHLSLNAAVGELAQKNGRAPTPSRARRAPGHPARGGARGAGSRPTPTAAARWTSGSRARTTPPPSPRRSARRTPRSRAWSTGSRCSRCWPPSPPASAASCILRFFGNMTQSQIAADIGISQMHVSRLLSQTLAKLREGLLKD